VTAARVATSRAAVLDASVMVAVLGKQRGHHRLTSVLVHTPTWWVCAANLAEAHWELSRIVEDGPSIVDGFCTALGVRVHPVEGADVRAVVDSYARWGQAPGQDGGLSWPDCFTVATCLALHLPLLTLSPAFSSTDVTLLTW